MSRILPAIFTLSLCVGVGAQAAEIVTLLPSDTARAAHDKLLAAAERACRKAMADDVLDDFGPMDDCVADSVRSARPAVSASVASSSR